MTLKWFNDLTIRNKLIAIIMATTTATIVFVISISLYMDRQQAIDELADETQALANLVADRSSAGLVFDDVKLILQNFNALESINFIVHACIYQSTGNLIADYHQSDIVEDDYPCPDYQSIGQLNNKLHDDYLGVKTEVWDGGEFLGYLYLGSDYTAINQRFDIQLKVALGSVLFALIISGLLARRLQRLVSEPIELVTHVAREVERFERDNVRVEYHRKDEIGELARAFNAMLDALDNKNRELINAKDKQIEASTLYRSLVESTSAIPWEMSLGEEKFSFVGTQAEDIFGYPMSQWYEKGYWKKHIVPEDYERVKKITEENISKGKDFIIEYRSPTYSGDVVWVRNDVKLIFSEGEVVRLQGFVLNISESKRYENALRQIAIGVSGQVGQSYFEQLSLILADLFKPQYVLIGEYASLSNTIKTLSACQAGELISGFEYQVANTPSQAVINDGLAIYSNNLARAFPNDKFITDHRLSSYIGLALESSLG
ncbi:MAG: PAS domain-containing protein, partial [Kangiellaceae bacterium]|nr:PAS domain-containing protein [Kangiellaceae bacterium]